MQAADMMSAQYFVVFMTDTWKIKFEGQYYGQYESASAAIMEAIDCANRAGKSGLNAQVFMRDGDGAFKTEWTYGLDKFPTEQELRTKVGSSAEIGSGADSTAIVS